MDDARPLFSTFKPIGEDNKASAKPGPNTTPVQPQRAEQPRGHHDADGRVGRGAAKGPFPPPSSLSPCPRAHTPAGTVSSWAASGAPCGEQSIHGARPHPQPPAAPPFPPGPARLLAVPTRLVPSRWGPAARAGGPACPDEAVVRADASQEAGGHGRAPSLVPRLRQPEVSARRGLKPGPGWPLQRGKLELGSRSPGCH